METLGWVTSARGEREKVGEGRGIDVGRSCAKRHAQETTGGGDYGGLQML
jgi:hypothetical protein